MADRRVLRLAASLLFAGTLTFILISLLHPSREPANNHAAAFAEYAASSSWTAIHLGQFAGMTIVCFGLGALAVALSNPPVPARWLAYLGAASAMVALTLYGALQAVDGVALKQAVNAWAAAPEGEKAVRFANAETVRWLEWGMRSYHSFALALSLALFAIAIVWSGAIPKVIGMLMGLAAMAYWAQGWILGVEGFSPLNHIPLLLSPAALFASSLWVLLFAWWPRAAS